MSLVPRYFNATQVAEVLTWPLVNRAVEAALKAVSETEQLNPSSDPKATFVSQPPRTVTKIGGRGPLLFTMPAYVGNNELTTGEGIGGAAASEKVSTLACKLVTSFPANEQRQPSLPSILANILLFSTGTGQLECIMDATQITAWRTASASIVATKYLYFRRLGLDASARRIHVAIIGCGTQGQSHALGMCHTFQVSNLSLWNRTAAKAEALAAQLRLVAPQTRVRVAASAEDAAAQADVICVGTFSAEALIGADMLKKRDVHINTVGAGQVHFGELAQDIYDTGLTYVDSAASACLELKDLKAQIVGEVGAVIRGGRNAPHLSADGISIFQSMGMAAEDATVAQAVYAVLKNTAK